MARLKQQEQHDEEEHLRLEARRGISLQDTERRRQESIEQYTKTYSLRRQQMDKEDQERLVAHVEQKQRNENQSLEIRLRQQQQAEELHARRDESHRQRDEARHRRSLEEAQKSRR